MGRPISVIRTIVRQVLNDEFVSGETKDFANDEIDIHITNCVMEMSQVKPYEVKETLTTTSGSKKLDISSIDDLLYIDFLEYPVDKDPVNKRGFEQFASVITMLTDKNPSADETVYLYCKKLHSVSEGSSTLSPDMEHVLVMGAAANTALSWINKVRSHVAEAVKRIADVNASIDNMTGRIDQAKADLTSGRGYINQVNYGGNPESDLAMYASRELANANQYLSQAQGYIREMQARFSVTGVVNSYQVWANNKLIEYKIALRRMAEPKIAKDFPR